MRAAIALASAATVSAVSASAWSQTSSWSLHGQLRGSCESLVEHVNKGLRASDVHATHVAGLMFDLGLCVQQDLVRAARLFQTASDGGSDKARLKLATAFALGRGVPQDYASAGALIRLPSGKIKGATEPGDYSRGVIHAVMELSRPAIEALFSHHGYDGQTLSLSAKASEDPARWSIDLKGWRRTASASVSTAGRERYVVVSALQAARRCLAPVDASRVSDLQFDFSFVYEPTDDDQKLLEYLLNRPSVTLDHACAPQVSDTGGGGR